VFANVKVDCQTPCALEHFDGPVRERLKHPGLVVESLGFRAEGWGLRVVESWGSARVEGFGRVRYHHLDYLSMPLMASSQLCLYLVGRGS
jgi:hypothetical protein